MYIYTFGLIQCWWTKSLSLFPAVRNMISPSRPRSWRWRPLKWVQFQRCGGKPWENHCGLMESPILDTKILQDGFKDSQISMKYPSPILTPAFCLWTFAWNPPWRPTVPTSAQAFVLILEAMFFLEYFPTCQVRVVRFYVSCLPLLLVLLLLLSSPLLSFSSSSSSSSSNCDPRSTLFGAGPQSLPSMRSVPCRTSTTTIHASVLCRTSTTTIHAQCSLPDLNRDHPRPMFPAGPQPRVSPPSVPCRTSTATIHAQCSLPDLNREYPRPVFPAGPQRDFQMSEKMSDRMPDRMPDRMSEEMPDRMSEDMPERMSEDMSDRMPDRMPEYMPEYLSDRLPEYMSE